MFGGVVVAHHLDGRGVTRRWQDPQSTAPALKRVLSYPDFVTALALSSGVVKSDCVFCKIAAHEVPSVGVYEDDHVYGFRDNNPQAPTHVLIIPKRHITDASTVVLDDAATIGAIYRAAQTIAKSERLANGWRMVANVGDDAGNSVAHLHLHLLGGRKLAWPPG